MAFYHRTQAFVLKKQSRRETDTVCTLFTKDFGKIVVWATGERKIASKMRGGLKLFCLSDIEFVQGKNRNIVTDTRIIEHFSFFQEDLVRLKSAYQIGRIVDFLIKGQEKDSTIWRILEETWSELNNPQAKNPRLLEYYVLWKLLESMGYQPTVESVPKEISNVLQYINQHKARETMNLQVENKHMALLGRFSREYVAQVL